MHTAPGIDRRPLFAALTAALAVVFGVVLSLGAPSSPGPVSAQTAAELPGGSPALAFEPNAGRFGPSTHYVANAQSGQVRLTDRGAVLTKAPGRPGAAPGAIAIRFPGADLAAASPGSRLPGVVNDLRGRRSEWRSNIPTYGGVTYASAYPGVDLDFYGREGALEYDFRLEPGVDPGSLETRIAGADSMRLNGAGDLVIRSGETRFVQRAPVSYQPADATASRAPVRSEFRLDGNAVSFDLGPYDRSRPLVIDPLALAFATRIGGRFEDVPSDIAVDDEGGIYIAGQTQSRDFPRVNSVEGVQGFPYFDAAIVKIAPSTEEIEYSTYLGGPRFDVAYSIAVDDQGSAYVSGQTRSARFNRVGGFEGPSGGVGGDGFVSKLSPEGDELEYSTFLGGTQGDFLFSLDIDDQGAAYVSGYTLSEDFDTVNAFQNEYGGGSEDVFISKISPDGSELEYSSYIGGADSEFTVFPGGVGVDDSGSAYVGGNTRSTDFPLKTPLPGEAFTDPGDEPFVLKVSPSGELGYSTPYSGSVEDELNGVGVDSDGFAYAIGFTKSPDLDVVGGGSGYSGGGDGFVAKLRPEGGELDYATYLGGPGRDGASDFEVDSADNVYFKADGELNRLTPARERRVIRVSRVPGSPVGGLIAVDDTGSLYSTGQDYSNHPYEGIGAIEPHRARDCADSCNDITVGKFVLPRPDADAPDTSIRRAPAGRVRTPNRRARVVFRFRTDDPPAVFQCSIDGEAFDSCDSPFGRRLGQGSHSFRVRAVDSFGRADASPARSEFRIVRTDSRD